MKTSSCVLGLIGLGWMIYVLFQPIFDGVFGWKTTPTTVYKAKFLGVESSEYQIEIASSKRRINNIQLDIQAPSISVAAMINGEMIWTYAVGFQDIANRIPADTSSQNRIGSVSKALTSLGLGKMIQKREINLDSSVQFYTNKFLEKPRITLRQLASHQSGIRNYGVCTCFPIWEYYRNKQFNSIQESIKDFEFDELLFNPGESFSYSSYNFTALSLAMEKASTKSFLQYMNDEVFAPLGMKNTNPNQKNKYNRNKAIPYETQRKLYKNSPEVDLSNKWAGGGYISTPSDLVRAGNALLNSSLIVRIQSS